MRRYAIRQATHADLEEAARVAAEAWREAYVGVMADDVLTWRADEEQVQRTAQAWGGLLTHGAYIWIGTDHEDDDRIVAVARACPSNEPDAPQVLQLEMFHVLERAQGTGLGDALLKTAIGDAPAYLWVITRTELAVAFLLRHGFRPDGATRRDEYFGIEETRMSRDGEPADEDEA